MKRLKQTGQVGLNKKMPKKKILFSVFMFLLLLTACNNAKDEELDGTMYTSKDVYIDSFECGYLPDFPRNLIMIETEEQLAYALEHYNIHNKLQELSGKYDIGEYTYIMMYEQVSNDGYYLHADRILINDYSPQFVMDRKSHGPGGEVSLVMGGFMHIAAVPKAYLEDYTFTDPYIIYPGEETISYK